MYIGCCFHHLALWVFVSFVAIHLDLLFSDILGVMYSTKSRIAYPKRMAILADNNGVGGARGEKRRNVVVVGPAREFRSLLVLHSPGESRSLNGSSVSAGIPVLIPVY